MIYETAADLDFRLEALPSLPRPTQVLLTTPEHFDVEYVINPHMEGHIGQVDQAVAWAQWNALQDAYASLGTDVHTIEGAAGLPDMVFCANQTLPYCLPGTNIRGVVLSRMYAPQRRDEVAHYASFFAGKGYARLFLPANAIRDFEGMGDAIWHPGRRLLWGGYGFRTDIAAYEFLGAQLQVPILALRLEDPDFYHLDTCLSVLDERTALIYPGAFQPEGQDLLRHLFETLIEAPEDEARQLFACNAHCPDQQHVIIQQGCSVTNALLRDHGFTPVEVDTSEFLKAGGSVYCMKQMFW